MLDKNDLRRLVETRGSNLVSIYLPTETAGPPVRQNAIRFKNLVDEATRQLEAGGLRAAEIDNILEPARRLQEDNSFWQYQAQGLAVFASADGFERHNLPLGFEETAVVNARYYVKPLLPLFAADGQYFVLAFNLDEVKLYAASRFAMRPLRTEELPKSFFEIVQETDYDDAVAFHPSGPPPANVGRAPEARFHSLGESPEDVRETEMIEFLKRLASSVEEYLSGRNVPLVLVAGDRLAGRFREFSHYKWLLPEGVAENPHHIRDEELHARTYSVIKPHFETARRKAMDQFGQYQGNRDARAASDPAAILRAARDGRVETLFVHLTDPLWGLFDAESDSIEIHEERQQGDEDLLDLAVAHTIATGGNAYALPADDVPGPHMIAAVPRY